MLASRRVQLQQVTNTQAFFMRHTLHTLSSVLRAASPARRLKSRFRQSKTTGSQASKIHKKLEPPDRVREAGRRPRRQGPGAVGRAALRRLEVRGHGLELVGLQRHVEQCR